MANTIVTPSLVAKAACAILDNNLVMANLVHRGHESEFTRNVNGYEAGATVNIRRPTQFTARRGAAASIQDVTEKTFPLSVDQQVGVDFQFTALDLTLNIKELAERVMKPAMVAVVNAIDGDLMSLYKNVWNWVGTPGTNVSSFGAFGRAGQRLDEMAVPNDDLKSVLSPADHWATLGTVTGLYVTDAAKSALRKAKLGEIGSIDTYKSQSVPTHTVGTKGGAPTVNGGAQGNTYATVGSTMIGSLITAGWTASQAAALKAGDVFTIAGVFAINPVSKAVLPYLQQFVVQADTASDGAGAATISYAPAIIASGAFQTVSAVPANGAAIVVNGTAATGYSQNLAFHKNAFTLAMVPMVKPPGSVGCARHSYKGITVRVIPYYNGASDVSSWRLDVLYGFKAIDPRLATRFNG